MKSGRDANSAQYNPEFAPLKGRYFHINLNYNNHLQIKSWQPAIDPPRKLAKTPRKPNLITPPQPAPSRRLNL